MQKVYQKTPEVHCRSKLHWGTGLSRSCGKTSSRSGLLPLWRDRLHCSGWDGVNWVALGTVSGNNHVFAFNLTSSSFVEQFVEVVPPPIGSAPKCCQRVCDARTELIRSAGRFVGKDYP